MCQLSKQHKQPIADVAMRADVLPGRVLHCDIKGPLDVSYNRCKFAFIAVDEYTRMAIHCKGNIKWQAKIGSDCA